MTFVAHTVERFSRFFKSLPNNLQAIFILLISMACFTTMAATIKFLGQSLHVTEIIAIRQGFMAILLSPALIRLSRTHVGIQRVDLLLLRAFLAFFSMLAGLSAIINLPLATATTLSFTRTFFLTVFAVLILKEVVGIRRIGALIVGFMGILVIARPYDMIMEGVATLDPNILFALISAATMAFSQIIIRIQSRYDQPSLIVSGQAILVGLGMIPLAYFHWQNPTLQEVGLILFSAILASFAQWMMVHAFKLSEATALAPFDYIRLLFSTAFGWILFNEWPDILTWIGAGIIFSSTFYIMRREAKLKKTRSPQTLD